MRTTPRTSTGVRFDPELYAELLKAADERDVSMNWLVNRAVREFLDRLLPVDEIRWTRDEIAAIRATPPGPPGCCPRCGSTFPDVRRLLAGDDDVAFPVP